MRGNDTIRDMAEQYNFRILFPPGKQRKFLLQCKKMAHRPWNIIAEKIGVHSRTLSDWKREKFSMSRDATEKLSAMSEISIPKSVRVVDRFWYVHKGASKGGRAVYEKYGIVGGDQEKRKKAWKKWWHANSNRIMRQLPILQPKPIHKPKFSASLAEFVGILLGDGGISKYQIVVTLNSVTDREYSLYIVRLFEKLFNIVPSVNKIKKVLALNIVVSRANLVRFCVNKLGLKIGNKIKQQVDIPDWVKLNKQFSIACVRGLVDTDGSIFTHRYRVGGKRYGYKKLDYTSISKPLLQSVYKILKENSLHPRLFREKSIRLDSVQNMQRYFEIFSTNNPKHLKRYYDKV